VQRPVEQLQRFVDENLDGVLGLGCFVKPARRFLLDLEAGEGADRGDPGQRQRRRLAVGLARLSPAAAGGGGTDLLQDEDGLGGLRVEPPDEVAPVGERQRPGELELDEPEQGQSPSPAEMPPLVRSGTAYFEGWTGTSGFSISPRRLIRRLHWPGFSSAAKRASIEPAVGR